MEGLKNINFEKEVNVNLNLILRDPELGLYCAYFCTEDQEEIIKVLNKKISDYSKCTRDIKLEVESLCESPVKQSSFFKEGKSVGGEKGLFRWGARPL